MTPRNHTAPTKRRCTHDNYLLTCEQYDELLDATGGRCQMCGIRGDDTERGVLSIDHEGVLGYWAVRGLLCQPCNVRVEWPDLRGTAGDAYLSAPWYRGLLDAAGIDGVSIPEPAEMGTYLTAGNFTYHLTEKGWQQHRRPKWPPLPITWRELCYKRGPHRIKIHGVVTWEWPSPWASGGPRRDCA